MDPASELFKDLDRRWTPIGEGRVALRIIGSTALMLQTNYRRGTKDSDVLETSTLTPDLQERLLKIAGKGTELHSRHSVYVEVVGQSIPFLPQVPLVHRHIELNRTLQHFEIELLDVVDVVVSKLKRFHANDQSDIRAMVDMGRVDHARLVERFRSAADVFSCDARAEDLPSYVANLNRVERDYLFVEETKIELPAWIE